MAINNLEEVFFRKCDIYYGDALITKEKIISEYINFFLGALTDNGHSVSFALHTGSMCFDFVSVVIAALGSLTYNLSSNEDIIAGLQTGDIVIYKNKRYRWISDEYELNGKLYMVLEQDGTGRNGNSREYVPQKNKYLIRPYYGTSRTTDGRGVRRKKLSREDFLSQVFDIPIEDVPSAIEIAVVIVADRNDFGDIYRNLKIVYGGKKQVRLPDIVPAAYYSDRGEEYQYGENQTKAEPVLKVVGKISTARDMVLDKKSNRVVALLVTKLDSLAENRSELADLLRRKSLEFVHVAAPINAEISEHLLDMCDDAGVFACTKDYLAKNAEEIKSKNSYTLELQRQVFNIVNNTVKKIEVLGGWSWEEYKQIKHELLVIKNTSQSDEIRDKFLLVSYGLLNLFTTACFSMGELEGAIEQGIINSTVISPRVKIFNLWEMAEKSGMMQDRCIYVTDAIEKKYKELLSHSPKREQMFMYLKQHKNDKIAIVVPKAYYVDILDMNEEFDFRQGNIVCIPANQFDANMEYDAILVVGDIVGKKFNPLQCRSTSVVDVLLYECEGKTFNFRRNKQDKLERKLNAQMNKKRVHVIDLPMLDTETDVEIADKNLVQEFTDLDNYIEKITLFDIRKLTKGNTTLDANESTSEVKYVGKFISGENILFSKYYSAVLYNHVLGSIMETSVDKLRPGDILVFTKRDDYTKNIVDDIYEKLISEKKLSTEIINASEKAFYWKETLREYKEKGGFTYRSIARQLRNTGCPLKEVTVRQWLMEDSHIVGPRNAKTMEAVAQVTKDSDLLRDTREYFEACRIVRHERRSILKLIEKAINDKLSGHTPSEESILKIVYDNVENLSEMYELECISELENSESIHINTNWVNRPITETEVLL